ncbi:unnamed protein product [Somion occarium]|uniref:Uncharacterized protein n=1 Tax=Somion occarium TaxID=3059160 RepID=A0ABP1D5C3_9APHY
MDFDTIVLGTGLSESILAAALSKAGFKVGHFDANPYYGGDDASLTVDDLRDWAESRKKNTNTVYLEAQRQRFSSISLTSSNVPRSRTFSISLSPTIIPSVGPLVDSLVASGVSRYGGFKLLESIAVFDQPSKVKPVPTSKEDVFKNKELSLVDKRRLMRFLLFAAGEFEGSNELAGQETQTFLTFLREKFSLANKVADAIAYALAFCTSPSDLTLPALQRIRRYLRSAGRYGPSPFLVGHYGGIGEIAQGFCRAAAVNGATYVLGRNIMSLNPPPKSLGSQANLRWSLSLDDLDEHPSSRIVAAQPAYISSSSPSSPGGRSARCVAIINTPIRFSEPPPELNDDVSVEDIGPGEIDTGLLIFPPSSVDSGSSTAAASCLITGEGSMATPSGHCMYKCFPTHYSYLDAEFVYARDSEFLNTYVRARRFSRT